MKLVPAFGSAGMSASFASAFDHVIYTEIKNGKHRAYSKSTASPKFLTRSRSDFAIEDLAIPSLASVFDYSSPTQNAQLQAPKPAQYGEKAVTDLSSKLAELRNKK